VCDSRAVDSEESAGASEEIEVSPEMAVEGASACSLIYLSTRSRMIGSRWSVFPRFSVRCVPPVLDDIVS
jgi:hypothetical protein